MLPRSKVLLGKYIFLKLVDIDEESASRLLPALENGDYTPFQFNEVLAGYLLEHTNLITPGTQIFYSTERLSIGELEKYTDLTYDNFIRTIPYKPFELDTTSNTSLNKIRSCIILSKRMTGNFKDFIINSEFKTEQESAFIHICYLLFNLYKDYEMIHGDS